MKIRCAICDKLWVRLSHWRAWGCPKGHEELMADLMVVENPDLVLIINA